MTDFLILLAYFLGSIPFALFFSRIFGTKDLRTNGSGNLGTTNMLRVGGKKPAIFTLIADVLKGTIAVLIAIAITDDMLIISACYIAAVLGHIFPIWLKFKGGKGVATNLGVMLAISPLFMAIVSIFFIILLRKTRISSLSALITLIFSVIIAVFFNFGAYLNWAIIINTLVIFYAERSNIKRLLNGEEKRVL